MSNGNDKSKTSKPSATPKPAIKDLRVRPADADKVKGGGRNMGDEILK